MYILADKLLGPKPRIILSAIIPPYETYNQIEAKLDAFGNALIDLEKKDAEAMSLLRSELEIKVLNAVKDMKLLQIQEAKEQIEILKRTKMYYTTISDVIIHVKYTAREGGSGLKNLANDSLKDRLGLIRQQLSQEGLHIAINLKHDLSNEWHLLKNNGTVDLKIDKSRLPYLANTLDALIENVMFVAKAKNNPATFSVIVDGAATNLSVIDEWKLYRGINTNIDLDTVFTLSFSPAQLNNLEELLMIVKYSF